MNALNPTQIAEKLGIPKGTLKQYKNNGRLPGIPFFKYCGHSKPCNCMYFVLESDLDEWLKNKRGAK